MKLLAPNGKPSNLTPEQYKLVRTPAFKEWFGDWENSPEAASKVVDENGEPKVVFHGSERSDSILISGIFKAYGSELNELYFTDNTNTALSYTYDEFFDDEEEWIDTEENIDNVIAVFLNIKNPKIKDFKGRTFTDFWNIKKDNDGNILTNVYDVRAINENLKRKDYLGNTYIVYKSEQIKLADGTNTTFDSNNPDIRYAEGGSIVNENYLRNITLMPESHWGSWGKLFKAEFGENGGISWEITESYWEENPSEKGLEPTNNPNYIIVQSIDRDRANGNYTKEASKGEGAMAIASLFLKYSKLREIGYDDYAESGFWQKIGGDSDILKREDFFKYFENKFGYNPDIRYKNGGLTMKKPKSKLLAPNGKPSNLTPEQYRIVRTPAFKEWFGDWEKAYKDLFKSSKFSDFSKYKQNFKIQFESYYDGVSKFIDENGEPKVALHFTRKWSVDEDGDEDGYETKFDASSWSNGKGEYYYKTPKTTVNPTWFYIETGSNNLTSFFGSVKDEGDRWAIPFFINVKRLFDTCDYSDLKGLEAYAVRTYGTTGHTPIVRDENNKLSGTSETRTDFRGLANVVDCKSYNTIENDYSFSGENTETSGSIPALLKEMGYDGYTIKDEGGTMTIFDKVNYKIADGSNTTFDGSNPNITFDNGGELTLTSEQVEQKLGRKLHWWNDDVVTINGTEYKKVFLKPEYKRL